MAATFIFGVVTLVSLYHLGFSVLTVLNARTEESSDTLLEVNSTDGAPGITILCVSSGELPMSVKWIREIGNGSLPSGVTQNYMVLETRQEHQLIWSRPIRATDGGRYTCSTSKERVQLNVVVRRSPIITSIYPNYPQVSGSLQLYRAPLRFRDKILTCNVLGWPLPTVAWTKESSTTAGNISQSTQLLIFTSAVLQFREGFMSGDFGSYRCTVQAEKISTQSGLISLFERRSSVVNMLSPFCRVPSGAVAFQFRVLTSDCSTWIEAATEQIAYDLEDVFASGIVSLCQECGFYVSIEFIQCSQVKQGASVFRGKIRNRDRMQTIATYCAMKTWFEFQPWIKINTDFKPIDPECILEVEPEGNTLECLKAPPSPSPPLPNTFRFTIGALVLTFSLMVPINATLLFIIRRRWKKRKESIRRIAAQKKHRTSMYEDDVPIDENYHSNVYQGNLYDINLDDATDASESVYFEAKSVQKENMEDYDYRMVKGYGASKDGSDYKMVCRDNRDNASDADYRTTYKENVSEMDYKTVCNTGNASEAEYRTVYRDNASEAEYKTVYKENASEADYRTRHGDNASEADYKTVYKENASEADYKTIYKENASEADYRTRYGDNTSEADHKKENASEADYKTIYKENASEADYRTRYGDNASEADYRTRYGDNASEADYRTRYGGDNASEADYRTRYGGDNASEVDYRTVQHENTDYSTVEPYSDNTRNTMDYEIDYRTVVPESEVDYRTIRHEEEGVNDYATTVAAAADDYGTVHHWSPNNTGYEIDQKTVYSENVNDGKQQSHLTVKKEQKNKKGRRKPRDNKDVRKSDSKTTRDGNESVSDYRTVQQWTGSESDYRTAHGGDKADSRTAQSDYRSVYPESMAEADYYTVHSQQADYKSSHKDDDDYKTVHTRIAKQ